MENSQSDEALYQLLETELEDFIRPHQSQQMQPGSEQGNGEKSNSVNSANPAYAASQPVIGQKRKTIPPDQVRQIREDLGLGVAPISVAFMNLRGGVGKTISTITTATRAVQYGHKTCILDLDSQGSATLAFNEVPEDDDPIFYDIWSDPQGMLMGSLRQIQSYLHLLPSSLQNGLLDTALASPVHQKSAVKQCIEVLKNNGFDFIAIDCPPSLGAAIISSICAVDVVVIPVGSDVFSFRGLELTLGEIQAICETFGIEMPTVRILFTRYDRREKVSIEAWEKLQDKYSDILLPGFIRTSSQYTRFLANHQSVFASNRKSIPRDDYDTFFKQLIELSPAEV